MEDYTKAHYPSNSKSEREPAPNDPVQEQRLAPVVDGKVKVVKKGLLGRFAGLFFSGDFNTAKKEVIDHVIKPGAMGLFSDICHEFIDAMIDDEGTGRYRRAKTDSRGVTDYHAVSSKKGGKAESRVNNWRNIDIDNFYVDSKLQGERVIDELLAQIETYKYASVGDLYDLLGLDGNSTMWKYGWTNLSSADVIRTRDGYKIVLPKPKSLEMD